SYRSFTGDNGIFRGSIDEIRLYNRVISNLEAGLLAGLESQEEAMLLDHAVICSGEVRTLQKKRSGLVQELIATMDTVSEVMVMEEMPAPRPTFVLSRGQYAAPLEKVEPTT